MKKENQELIELLSEAMFCEGEVTQDIPKSIEEKLYREDLYESGECGG